MNPTARRDSTGGPPGGRPVGRRAGSSARQRSRTKDCPKAGGYRPLRRQDVTFETREGQHHWGWTKVRLMWGQYHCRPDRCCHRRRGVHQLHCQNLRHRQRHQRLGGPRCRRPQGVDLQERERQVPPKTRDMPLQVSQKEETGMTALHPMVMERTVVMERRVVTERAVGVRMAQKAMTMGVTIKAETIMGTMEMKNPNTVV